VLGGYYAATDGVLMALASARLPTSQQASGLALLVTATTLAKLAAALMFGALWTAFGLDVAALAFAAGLAIAAGGASVVLARG
jgi:hypothetical protein